MDATRERYLSSQVERTIKQVRESKANDALLRHIRIGMSQTQDVLKRMQEIDKRIENPEEYQE